nr:MAG TPA: hypothetical protein [Caudoviricetes sp.]
MSLKPLFKIFAAVVLFSTMFSEPTDTTYLRGIMNLVAISIFMQEEKE